MATIKSNAKAAWWKEAVVYQVYPASFLSTGSGSMPGWGDIRGITSKLDYLKHLGVNVLWPSPIFKSPQVDMGYDISDYKDIDPRYGTLDDVDELIRELKKRDMKLIMDLVVNHTSDQHAWFLDSRSSKSAAKRDWYIWQPAKYDDNGNRKPPNNWGQILGDANSAWAWDKETQEYYLALFTPEQPDLNWRNPEVRAAVHDVLKFWLDRGCSGFRMDVINLISKVDGYPDAPIINPDVAYQPGNKHFANGPHLHEYLREINEKVLSKYDSMTVGEMPFVHDWDEIIKVVGADRHELNMIFLFDIVSIDDKPNDFRMTLREWPKKEIREIQTMYQRLMLDRDGWNSLFIENHDNPRSVSRYTSDTDEHRAICSKLLCIMQTTLAGTLFVYQGEELGMRNLRPEIPPEEYVDIESINYWQKMKKLHGNDPAKLEEARKLLHLKARDNARTPVQWTGEVNAGFCAPDVKPWMMVNTDYQTVNAQAQRTYNSNNDLSVLQFWKRGLQQRREHGDVFVYGDFQLLDDQHECVFAYKRVGEDGEAFVTVLNFSGKEVSWSLPESAKVGKWVVSNYSKAAPENATSGVLKLNPWEGLLGRNI
ncbi:glycoside hydrolase family 13 protein [Baudoinia panamericana UAMH 10762]|uniref:Glycoside hydrolase family 13 protein n=1 Tax=Baudoinia panamericana (strain UAMH 10762) TaxID=717646 RepID=M2MVM6_BAUPA|nr:glycoside hydrolase family 13 protein [Baudoinia panamericana UAMH 10762]EMD01007.1 glycoside hydrolase family 13 protein [Baudoinia panamericana UAMH 10762]